MTAEQIAELRAKVEADARYSRVQVLPTATAMGLLAMAERALRLEFLLREVVGIHDDNDLDANHAGFDSALDAARTALKLTDADRCAELEAALARARSVIEVARTATSSVRVHCDFEMDGGGDSPPMTASVSVKELGAFMDALAAYDALKEQP